MMDLRWGLREESQDNHTVIEFCIQEIENCAKMSLGPSFVVCLSQLSSIFFGHFLLYCSL